MAFSLKDFIFSTFIILLLVSSLVLTCPESCNCDKNLTSCFSCSYNVSLMENVVEKQVQVCCNEDLTKYAMMQNKHITFSKTVIEYGYKCDSNIVDFNFPNLSTVSITLHNNSISKFRINVKFSKVREINLSQNKLKYINKELFGNFTNLRVLILRKNQISEILKDSFLGLSKLETLDLSENCLKILTNVFTPLKSLQFLNISRNSLEFLYENYFDNWLLQHLDVSYNNLRIVAPGALQQLPNLARLLLTDNPHLGITQLDTQLLVGTGRRLQQIDASRTGLYQVPEAFTHSVRFLSLVGNNITSIRCGDLDSYPLLQSLDFTDNKIISVEDDSLGRLEMLIYLNINNNYLNVVPKSLPDELKYLSINNNLIKNLSVPDFNDLPNLRILLIKNNQINYIENHVFDDLLSLEMLDLSNNPIKYLSSNTFDGPLSLRDLRLCYLNITMPVKDGSFPMSSPETVQMLHLQASPGLAKLLLADSAALAALSHLQYLDLRMNNISVIRNDLLFYLVQLKTIRLHGNKLNCSNETWLNDWMNWNKSSSHGETCYYSTSEAKQEITKYNCTFPETFTISDSLPPVNLYSTEMINKLLRYYGYLSNKTEKTSLKFGHKTKNPSLQVKKIDNKFMDNNITISLNESKIKTLLPIRKSADTNSLNGEKIQNYENKNSPIELTDTENFNQNKLNVDIRLLDIESYSTKNYRKGNNNNITDINQKKLQENGSYFLPSKNKKRILPILDTNKNESRHSNKNDGYTIIDPHNKLEYSPYQSTHTTYFEYFGTVSISVLVLMALILWASFRLRFKRRQMQAVNSDIEDQIEVSNISGGVLW